MTTEYKDAASIKAGLERLYHERAHLSHQLSSGDGEVKAAPVKLKDVSENIQSLEERLRQMLGEAA